MACRAMLAVLALAFVFGGGEARAEVVRRQPAPALRAGGEGRLSVFRRATAKARATPAQVAEAEAKFTTLPPDAQDALLAAVGVAFPAHALGVEVPKAAFVLPSISAIFPGDVSPGEILLVHGSLFNGDCAVYFRGVKAPSALLYGIFVVRIPATTPRGTWPLVVRDEVRRADSAPTNVPVVAKRGFRGVHGFGFQNFASGPIGWPVFRNYFGEGEVEFTDGTRRPAAEAWYEASYRGVAGGGNCYGMSMRSVRSRFRDWRGTQSAWWAANQKPRVWDYPKAVPVVESIMWDQGGQLSAQAAAVINARMNGQSNFQAFVFVRDALAAGKLGSTPILGLTGAGGHAIVGWATEETAGEKTILVWDSNKPYATTEVDDGGSRVRVFTSGALRYGAFTRLTAFTYDELNPADPALPASAAGAMNALGSGLGVVVVDDPAALVEVTDAQGRWLFRNGADNWDPKTRIPNASRFEAFSGGPARPGDPAVFIFGSAKGATYDVRLRPDRAATVRSFSRGFVSQVAGARGTVRLARWLEPEQAVELPQPALSRPSSLKLIAVEGDGSERVFDVLPRGVLPGGPMTLKLELARKGVVVHNAGATPLDVQIGLQGFTKAGARSTKLMPVSRVPAGGTGALTAPDFGKLESLAPGAFRVRP